MTEPEDSASVLAKQALALTNAPWGSDEASVRAFLGDRGFTGGPNDWSDDHSVMIGEFIGKSGVDGNFAISKSGLSLLNLFGVQLRPSNTATLDRAATRVIAMLSTHFSPKRVFTDGQTIHEWTGRDEQITLAIHRSHELFGMLQITIEP